MTILPQDQQFYAALKAHLDAAARRAGGAESFAVPVTLHPDGSIDRERTLDLPCYSGLAQTFVDGKRVK